MITRIVKMEFQPEMVDHFLDIFREVRPRILAFEGCRSLELLRDQNDPAIFFTWSAWDSAADLEGYRQSELFRVTWQKTRALFRARAFAWTVENVSFS